MRSAVACRPDFDPCRTSAALGRHRGPGGGASFGFGGTTAVGGGVGGGVSGGGGSLLRRQVVMRPLGSSGRRQRAARPPSIVGGAGGLNPNQIQLISLPQLDLVQRSLKVLDVRVQRLHTAAIEEDKVWFWSFLSTGEASYFKSFCLRYCLYVAPFFLFLFFLFASPRNVL
jgi:hypothetical protein